MENHIRLAVVGPRCELKEAPWDFLLNVGERACVLFF